MAAATAVEASALDELRFVLEGVFARIEQYERLAPPVYTRCTLLCIINWKMD